MNNYKFGNYICKLREARGMTQAELAKNLEVSDKAISKWENGQAFPRMDTFEKLASHLDTTIEDILSASKDGIKRICLVNNFCSVMQIEINDQLLCLRNDESKWTEIAEEPIILKITGELLREEELEGSNDAFKDALLGKAAKSSIKQLLNLILQVDCTYQISSIEPDTILTIDADFFDVGDKTLMFVDFQIVYPKITAAGGQIELLSAKGKNSKEVIKQYKKLGLLSDLGVGFLFMFLSYPIRGFYFRYLCKPKILKKNIINARLHQEKTAKRERKKVGCLSTLLLILLLLIAELFIVPFFNIKNEKPALLSEDYSQITYYDEIYTKIEALPSEATAKTLMGATIWEDVRQEGLSRINQLLQDDKVMLYEGQEGRKYLWLVENYTVNMDEEYEDCTDPLVYMYDPEKS